MTTIDDVLTAIVTRVEALALTFNAAAVPVGKRKHPRQEDGDTRHTQFTVSEAQRSHESRRFDSVSDLHTYRAELVFWTPSNGDNRGNIPALAALEDAPRMALNTKPADLAGIDGVFDVRAESGTFLNRAAFMAGWDAQLTNVEVEVVKAREE